MASDDGHCIGVFGATGALGSEVLASLDRSSLRVAELVPVATDRSLGEDIEFQGEIYPVMTEVPNLRRLDFVFLCAPATASLEVARLALKVEVPGIDCSGALAASHEVPLYPASDAAISPLVAVPDGPVLAWALALRPLEAAFGVRRVTVTGFEPASMGGRAGIEALHTESLSLFNQQDRPDPTAFAHPVAFDCVPGGGEDGGASPRERHAARTLARLLGPEVKLAVTLVQVPTFVGHGSVLSVETERPCDPAAAQTVLRDAPGVALTPGDEAGPSTRTAAGREEVLVGRVREDPSVSNGLLLWTAGDALCLVSHYAVTLAEARLAAH